MVFEEKNMTIEQKIRMALGYRKMSQADLAREIGLSPSNFHQRLGRGNFSVEELERIGEALGAKFHCEFEFEDGTKI